MKPEILAPAGNMDALKAAVLAGCDAVYLGGKSFGARSFAGNFSDEELKEAITYCHLYGVNVYITVNTLVYEQEIDKFIAYIDFLVSIHVDALIMQDIGMIYLVRKRYPNLPIHASTQLHIHNEAGTKIVQEMGLTRVVLARETSIEEIKKIQKETTIELEIFVHGALCISYSGQCLMSSLIGNRSGNRGSCAQCCRQAYDLLDENLKKVNTDSYLLSTKDLNTLDNLEKLLSRSVTSLKIEGRMKRPEYVYTVVSLYRKAVDSYFETGKISISSSEIKDLQKIFNRQFTKGFLFHEENNQFTNPFRPNHLGIEIGHIISYRNGKAQVKLKEEFSIQDGIRILGKNDIGFIVTSIFYQGKRITNAKAGMIVEIPVKEKIENNSVVVKTTDNQQIKDIQNQLMVNKRTIPLTGIITLQVGKQATLQFQDKNHIIKVTGKNVETATNTPLSKDTIEKQINKLGNTIYTLENLEIIMDSNVFYNIKDLNELRRQAVEEMNTIRIKRPTYSCCTDTITVPDFSIQQRINIDITNENQYRALQNKNIYNYYVEDKNLYQKIKENSKVIYHLPRVIKNYDTYPNKVLISEIGGLTLNTPFITDVSFNVVNSYSVAFLHNKGSEQVTLSYELTYQQVKQLIDGYTQRYQKHPNVEVIVYGTIEAMISKYNLLKQYNLSKGILQDRFKNQYPIINKGDYMVIQHYQKRHFQDNYFAIGVNAIRYTLFDEAL